MWETWPAPPLAPSGLCGDGSTDGAGPPAGASALCQLGPRVGGQQLFPETPSLGSREGVKWGEPLLSQEEA